MAVLMPGEIRPSSSVRGQASFGANNCQIPADFKHYIRDDAPACRRARSEVGEQCGKGCSLASRFPLSASLAAGLSAFETFLASAPTDDAG